MRSWLVICVLLTSGAVFAQPAGVRSLHAGSGTAPGEGSGLAPNEDPENDQGTIVSFLGDATVSVTDTKNVNAVGVAIRGPKWHLRFFVSNASISKVTADPGDRAFGRSILSPEIGGVGAAAMVRYLPGFFQAHPSTRWGFVLDLVGQHTTWETGGLSGTGLVGGSNLGATVFAEDKMAEPNSSNGLMAYFDVLLMARGINRDFHTDLRQLALGRTDRAYGGVGIRAGAKINQLTFSATYSFFPSDNHVEGLTSGQLFVSIGIDSGLDLQWAKSQKQRDADKKADDEAKKKADEAKKKADDDVEPKPLDALEPAAKPDATP